MPGLFLCQEMEEKTMANLTNAVKQHILENYQKYDVTNSKEEMLGLLNVLEPMAKRWMIYIRHILMEKQNSVM